MMTEDEVLKERVGCSFAFILALAALLLAVTTYVQLQGECDVVEGQGEQSSWRSWCDRSDGEHHP